MKMKIAVASLLAAASMTAFAADQTVSLTVGGDNFFNSVSLPGDGVLSGGHDVLTFDGLAPGLYDIVITISGQNLAWDAAATTLNGRSGAYDASSGRFKFLGIESTDQSPFVLDLAGTAFTGAKYSGEVSISPVPEPTTYGMLLGGLGVMGFLARRKAKKA
jgi:hypothetical protein